MADFSPDATKKYLDAQPPNQAGIGVAVDGHDLGVQGAVKKEIGKGWTVSAAGEWFKEKGYRAAAWLNWKGRG